MNRYSLRARLLFLSATLLAVGLVTNAFLVSGALSGYLMEQADSRLKITTQICARLPAAVLAASPGSGRLPPQWSRFSNPVVFYADDRGTVLTRTPPSETPPGGGPDLPTLDAHAVDARNGDPFTVDSRNGEGRWRVMAVPYVPGADAPAGDSLRPDNVIVAASLSHVDDTVSEIRTISATVGGVLLCLLTAVGRLAVRSSLRPLTRIEETAAAIAHGDFSRRVPTLAGPRTEAGRLTASLNGMLVQIETAFQAREEAEAHMRRFVADASHEMRTPLVGIKGYTDLYRMGALPSRGDVDETMGRIARESERLGRLVEDMLLLARLDESTYLTRPEAAAPTPYPLELAPMDLRTLAVDALHDIHAMDPARRVTLTGPDAGKATSAPALADEARLRQVVSNLVGNAVDHTPPGSGIRVGVGSLDGHAVIEIEDTGPGLTADEQERVFERFYRADNSRSRTTGGGSGLGLAIVQALVSAHGGRVELRSAPAEGCCFRVLLPRLDIDPHET
ncbi:HAMP domain-containing sensor histidine kinase [Streptomyces sp. NPDC093249]|uniref:sensor histidine kinase n=1 Tax=unclassified Streptomyces TaxID=2593676 RepID=UPI0034505758